MRSCRPDEPLIGVSCGHKAERASKRHKDGRNLYWCATCSAWRMSGAASTGERAHAWAEELRQLIEDDAGGFEFVFRAEPPAHVRRLMRSLGVEVVVDPDAFFERVQRPAAD